MPRADRPAGPSAPIRSRWRSASKEIVISHRRRPTNALVLAAAAPTAAQARPIINASPPETQQNLNALASTSSAPPQAVTVSAPGRFDWGDAGIRAGLGLGHSLTTLGTGLMIGGRRRHHPHATIR